MRSDRERLKDILESPFCGSTGENALEKCTTGGPEGSSASVEGWSWWPIGTRCALVEHDGTEHEAVVPPWRGDPWADLR